MPPQNTSSKKFLNTRLAVILLLVLFILIVLAVVKNANDQRQVDENTGKLDAEIVELEQDNIELQNLIEFFASEEFIEREAREKLNLTKPGEKVVIVPEESKDVIRDQMQRDRNERGSSKLWWEYFFGN